MGAMWGLVDLKEWGRVALKEWGWVALKENGEINEIWYGRESETEGIDELPEWVKTKMAMLDFMDECIELPCGSYWYMLVNEEYENPLEPLKTYFICED